MPSDLPVIGAALTLATLETLHPWLVEANRDVEVQDFISPEVLKSDWRQRAERARQLLEGHSGRIGIHGPFYDLPLDARNPDTIELVRKRLMQGLDACAVLGATHMVVHSPYTTWDHFNLDARPDARLKKIERCHVAMTDAVKRAEELGVVLVIENIEDIDPGDRLALADSFNSPAVAVSIDTGHAFYAHGATGAPPVDYFVKSAGTRLAHVHIQDADGYADRHWPPGKGTLNWHAFFAALAKTGASPRLVLELADETRLREGADWLIAEGLCQ